MEKFLKSKYGLLIFSLVCGGAYFALIMMLIIQVKYAYLLGIFFFPTVICGGALCIYKTIRNEEQEENYAKIKMIVGINVFFIILAAAFVTVGFLV